MLFPVTLDYFSVFCVEWRSRRKLSQVGRRAFHHMRYLVIIILHFMSSQKNCMWEYATTKLPMGCYYLSHPQFLLGVLVLLRMPTYVQSSLLYFTLATLTWRRRLVVPQDNLVGSSFRCQSMKHASVSNLLHLYCRTTARPKSDQSNHTGE